MYGELFGLTEYKGVRDRPSITKFMQYEMTVPCGPRNLQPCDGPERERIAQFQAMDRDELTRLLDETDAQYRAVEEDFAQTRRGFAAKWDELKALKDEKERELRRNRILMERVFNELWEVVEVDEDDADEEEAQGRRDL